MTLPIPSTFRSGRFADRILDTLLHRIGKDERAAKPHDWLAATILTVRDQVIDQWMTSTRAMHAAGAKRVYYLSLEFLIGRLLRDALSNLGLTGEMQAALASLRRRPGRRSRSWSRTRRWAMAAWAGWPPASWKAWPPSICPPAVMASAISTACSASASRMAGSSNIQKPGWRMAIPGNSTGARPPI